MNMARYYDMGRSPAKLLVDWVCGWSKLEFSDSGRPVIFTQSGRAAIALAARLWDIGPDDEVLIPAYNCGSEISPLIATGAKVSMYRVDSRARIDIGDLLRRVTPRTRMVHVTHYFGWPSDLSELARYCRQHNIKILEDCALSLFSRGTGHTGDAAIFSLRKSLPVPDGGILSLRSTYDSYKLPVNKIANIGTARSLLSLVKKWAQRVGRISLEPQRAISSDPMTPKDFPPLPASYYWTASSSITGPSRFSMGLLKRSDPREVIRRRRDNYAQLRRSLDDVDGCAFLWADEALPDGMCPLGMPVLVDHRRWWCSALNAAGVAVSPWWEGYHHGLQWSEFSEACALKSRLLLLPVHQDLSARDIDYIASTMRSLVRTRTLPK
jgi:perosamine synthetase